MPNEILGSRVATVYELQAAWLEPKLQQIGVRWTSFQLLATILGCGDEASQAEVARRLGLAPATLSESVQNHVKQNLVIQQPSPHDKRIKILALTPKGKRLMGQVKILVQECESVMTKGLSKSETKTCAKVLDQMIEKLDHALDS